MNVKGYTYKGKKINSNLLGKERTINSEFSLFVELLLELFVYLFLLVPRLFGLIFYFFLNKKEKSRELFSSLFSFPFELFQKLSKWFFQAKYTSYLILFLLLVFIFQQIYLNGSPYLQSVMTHPLHIFEGNYYSLITSLFLHADIFHLLSNILALLIFGRVVEKHLSFGVLWIFLLGGILANLVSHLISYYQTDFFFSLGASGGIATLIMLGILLEPFVLSSFPLLLPLPLFLIGWLLLFFDLIGLTNPSQINNIAHLGGYASSLVLSFFLEFRQRKKIYKGLVLNIVLFLALFFLFLVMEIEFESIRILLFN